MFTPEPPTTTVVTTKTQSDTTPAEPTNHTTSTSDKGKPSCSFSICACSQRLICVTFSGKIMCHITAQSCLVSILLWCDLFSIQSLYSDGPTWIPILFGVLVPLIILVLIGVIILVCVRYVCVVSDLCNRGEKAVTL